MSEQPKDPRPPDDTDSDTARLQSWTVRPAEPSGDRPEPAPARIVEGLRTLYG